ncbi:4Fe-4S dicluster domain-containing protein [Pelotomaculum terephthalicicum JT]|uniref:heterodisulfide reductase-related iron-sulfur binding cluster n=3 Tax=Pelotomaculum TaxID=191373 RepID=UPI0009D4A413|nr:heterodisulfide reductase-related iron-sulfur binding cluster [Pelotomaculum terephthalicicum]MCG9968100.1 4Fe-4S dicluster domain-containing protein [Pelotomaculum terephthalicicum JT]OPY64028.1 MAG: succinate dehydrogenase/fumarate reductase iron-sulfur subunit [Pelotomaculum sp. PtaU1.Bin065]
MLSTTGIIVFILLLAVAGYFCVMGLAKLYNRVRIGRPIDRSDRLMERIMGFFGRQDCQRKIAREPAAALMHLPILYGVILFILGAVHLALEKLIGLVIFGSPYFYLITEIGGILLLFGMLYSAWRRYVQKIPRLDTGTWEEERFIVFLISDLCLIVVAFFLSYGFKLIASPEYFDQWRLSMAPASLLVASLFNGVEPAMAGKLELVFWWVHILAAFTLIGIPRYSPLLHPAAAPLNIIFRYMDSKIEPMEKIDFEDEERETFGVNKLSDFTWKDLLDCYACAECGRCQDNCPAYLTDKPLSPKKLLAHIKEHLEEIVPGEPRIKMVDGHMVFDQQEQKSEDAEDAKKLLGEVIDEHAIWACTTCRACREQCPNMNEHANKIMQLRRAYVLDESDFPAEAQLTFTNMERNSNPWGIGWADRANWAADLDVKILGEAEDAESVEYLFYVGCAGSFDDRIKKVSTALVKVLKEAGVSFGILGTEEKCCGDSARRLGNEYLFQSMAEENIETFKGYGVKKIITACPHCFTVMKTDYKQMGADFEIIHHTQLIDQLIKAGKIKPGALGEQLKATYHDSCYLGRYNEEYDAPRNIIAAVKGVSLVEMTRSKQKGFCCGAGGGRMWLEEDIGKRINIARTEQALELDPQAIICNCPFCLTMLEDGLKDKEATDRVKVYDVAELVARISS